MMSANLRAFLFLIRWCEGTSDEAGYCRIVGGSSFGSWSDHPRILKSGVFNNGKEWKSTAAGAYQFLASTWDECKTALDLPDFSPESQDKAAVYLIQRRGALHAVEEGNLDQAISICNKEWASLPGSPYGQPTKSMDSCRVIFERAGGHLMQSAGGTPQVPDSSPVPGSTAPSEGFTMPPFLIPVLAAVIEAVPTLMRAFKGNSKIVERNARAVELVGNTIKTVTGESSVLAAAERVLSDPQVQKQTDMAFQQIYFDLIEVGGGIEAARKVDVEFRASGDSVWKSPSFIVATLLLPLVYIGMLSVSMKLPVFPDWPVEVRIGVINTVMGMIIGALVGYYFGMMTSRNRAAVVKEGT